MAGISSEVSLVGTGLKLFAILLVSLVAGTTFGIWQGYDPAGLPPEAFMLMHQGAVRGLNLLLPATAAVAIGLTILLAIRARRNRPVLTAYALAILLMIVAGLITRLANQPINAEVMTWSAGAIPAGWEALRDSWWQWHVTRTIITIVAEIVLVLAVLFDRRY
ncbi:MAG: DUF1772 domain-containing protein [Rhizobium sp.]|nr:DUF1772 domain-containing protein [Rhizobium sp.]